MTDIVEDTNNLFFKARSIILYNTKALASYTTSRVQNHTPEAWTSTFCENHLTNYGADGESKGGGGGGGWPFACHIWISIKTEVHEFIESNI